MRSSAEPETVRLLRGRGNFLHQYIKIHQSREKLIEVVVIIIIAENICNFEVHG